ncbi:hypothetical protein Glove_330g88 [Diversispora epigaea]|uniref:Uncharacterized protein n=1 Tax=Diversispora epigaea TaxID=1348612 RepID=A0A397HJM8_9GLOM|nr:hypothetical protein Glove_330g88 [Diversispora epigaea]
MTQLTAKIKSFLLKALLKTICSESIFYSTIDGDEVSKYNTIRTLTEHVVHSVSQKIENNKQRTKVVNILLEIKSGYNTIISLKALKALNITQELTIDYTREEIEQNVKILKTKLDLSITNANENLYGTLKKNINEELNVSELTWKNLIVIEGYRTNNLHKYYVYYDNVKVIEGYRTNNLHNICEGYWFSVPITFINITFMLEESRENMKCEVPRLISSRIDEFVENFDEINNSNHIKNIVHDKL